MPVRRRRRNFWILLQYKMRVISKIVGKNVNKLKNQSQIKNQAQITQINSVWIDIYPSDSRGSDTLLCRILVKKRSFF